ncbi:hypothetical protein [Algicella marina]|uniref:SnoaL-like domain-containing protein n=1 Tax=Algicella marina TaxID=2683284 RepID=A0A6P1T269_9RHOB|nr:hypothetical protein [Algicella marina]QHQ35556.1 hypothetical protein GO499_10370 [Algicella marina]
MAYQFESFFDAFASSLLQENNPEICHFYERRSLCVDHNGAESYLDHSELLALFKERRRRLQHQGISQITARIESTRAFAIGLTMVEVSWHCRSATGTTLLETTSTYVVRGSADGLRVAIDIPQAETDLGLLRTH